MMTSCVTLFMKRPRRRKDRSRCQPVDTPQRPNELWAMDFMSDQLEGGSRFRMLTVLDVCSRECITVEVGRSLASSRVSGVLNELMLRRDRPRAILADNGPEFASREMAR